MNRRNFLTSGTLTAGALSLVPTSIFANNNTISIFSIGKGFNSISDQIQHLSVKFLSKNVLKAHTKLLIKLDEKGYNYSNSDIVQLSNNCYAIPLSKKPLIGFDSKELALLIEQNGVYKHYILNEPTSIAFNSLIENFSRNSEAQSLNLDTLNFISPNEVIGTSFGKENTFTYKNVSGNTITLKGSSKKQVAIIS
ncbi:hypothetical protein [Aquimarina sp. 2201CG14-23]|uniref:hypothetical protein n=1 Tax=Aquimarina mycalae TaxID=3040073 RepID=UPI0024782512|nr:hypothetical protein [Aquimarina sp. 2201CG14-23]MDH7445463.1 hypothetical protein [Aquimarina sp. 2201CG14-23]